MGSSFFRDRLRPGGKPQGADRRLTHGPGRTQIMAAQAVTSAASRLVGLCFAAALFISPATTAASAGAACRPWSVRTIASGLGVLENLTFDGRGSMLISASQSGAIERMTPDGRVTTLIPDVSYPGGLVMNGRTLFFNTGDSPQSGVLGSSDGTIGTFNLDTRVRTTWSSGLVMPNGLALLPDGDAVVTRVKPVLGTPTGMTLIPAADPTHPRYNWARLDDTNGLVLDPSGRWLYTDQTFTPDSAVYRIRVSDPSTPELVAHLATAAVPAPLSGAGSGQPRGLDDMGFGPGGFLYIAANGA